jgi:indole-3-glycerol phosphate synthase
MLYVFGKFGHDRYGIIQFTDRNYVNRLDTILESKRREVEARRARADIPALEAAARAIARRPFAEALVHRGPSVIAEMKKASPSKGLLREKYDPLELARAYYAAGAHAISVLTDEPFFQGSLAHLRLVREAVPLPLLRKDFMIDPFQMLESAAAGADAILLIVAAFPADNGDAALRCMMQEARNWGLDALLEVHDDTELDRALDAQATLVGVNNRNLRTFEVDVETSVKLAAKMTRAISVSESGLRTAADLARLHALGYNAFLVGEQLVTADDPGAALAALLSC